MLRHAALCERASFLSEYVPILPCHCLVVEHVSQEASGFQYLSASLQDLVRRMLTLDPAQRISTDAIASHPWLAHAASPPPAVTVGADEAEAAARDWSTFWPDAESLTASAGAASAGVGLPTVGSLGSDDSFDMGAYHARLRKSASTQLAWAAFCWH